MNIAVFVSDRAMNELVKDALKLKGHHVDSYEMLNEFPAQPHYDLVIISPGIQGQYVDLMIQLMYMNVPVLALISDHKNKFQAYALGFPMLEVPFRIIGKGGLHSMVELVCMGQPAERLVTNTRL